MRVQPELDPDITIYDEEHFVIYLRLLDADAEGADWTEAAQIVLHRDPGRRSGAHAALLGSHFARARWLTKTGYRWILEQAVDEQTRLNGR